MSADFLLISARWPICTKFSEAGTARLMLSYIKNLQPTQSNPSRRTTVKLRRTCAQIIQFEITLRNFNQLSVFISKYEKYVFVFVAIKCPHTIVKDRQELHVNVREVEG